MRIALVIDDYMPNSTRVGAKMFHELAVEMQNMGCDVTVITPDSELKQKLVEEYLDGVKIWRFKSGPIKDVGKIVRALNESILSLRAWASISGRVDQRTFDGVVYYSPSIFFGALVKKIKKRCSCKAYLVLRDLFPQWVIDAKIISENSLIARYFRYFEKLSYRQASMIGLMSQKNVDVFKDYHFNEYSMQILRNWASPEPYIANQSEELSVRKSYNLEDKVIFFYGGNIGVAQDMPNLMRLARSMQTCERAHFLFVGQGDQVDLICRLAREWNLSNFTYIDSVNQQTFKSILSEIDVGLFSLAKHHTAHNFPGKLLGYMVESKPILGSVNDGNDLIDVISDSHAGLVHVNGDDELLYNSAIKLLNDEGYRLDVGRNANGLLQREFSVKSAADSILNHLK